MIDYGLVLSIINDSDDPITAFETFVKQETDTAYHNGLSHGRSERDDTQESTRD